MQPATGVSAVSLAGVHTSPGAADKPVKGGTAMVAVISGSQPDYIWPFRLAINYSVLNAEMFQWLLFRPLCMFGSNGTFILYAGPEPGADRADRDTQGHGITRQRCESRVWQ